MVGRVALYLMNNKILLRVPVAGAGVNDYAALMAVAMMSKADGFLIVLHLLPVPAQGIKSWTTLCPPVPAQGIKSWTLFNGVLGRFKALKTSSSGSYRVLGYAGFPTTQREKAN